MTNLGIPFLLFPGCLPAALGTSLALLVALQNNRAGGVDVGHQLVCALIAAVGVVALGELEISRGELLAGDRRGVDPEPLEQCKGVVEEQFSAAAAFNVLSIW